MKNAFILLRADANSEIGFGHLVRILAIHKACRRLKISSVIITDKLDSEAEKWLDRNSIDHFPVERIDAILTNNSPRILLFDIEHKLSSKKDYDILKKSTSSSQSVTKVAFADLSKKWKTIGIDILIYPYIGYSKDLHLKEQNQIHGPEYFILRDEIHSRKQKRTINPAVQTILITMGGSNLNKSIEKALSICLNMVLDKPIKIEIIVGPSAKLDLSKVEKNIKESQHEVTIHWNHRQFEERLNDADVIFTNDGLTKYETIFLGIPTVTLVTQKQNEPLMNNFAQETGILNLGYFRNDRFIEMTQSLEALIKSEECRIKMSEKGMAVIDGKGTERLLKKLLK